MSLHLVDPQMAARVMRMLNGQTSTPSHYSHSAGELRGDALPRPPSDKGET
jgi:hypothetical protein